MFVSNEFSESEVTCLIGKALLPENLPVPREPISSENFEDDFSPRSRMRSENSFVEQYPCVPSATYKCIMNYDYETNFIWASHEVIGSLTIFNLYVITSI